MKVQLDSNACTGHGRCYALAPDVFDSDDEGRSVVKVAIVRGGHLRAAEIAVASCPEQAISLVAAE